MKVLCFLNFDSTISLYAMQDNEFAWRSDDPKPVSETFLGR